METKNSSTGENKQSKAKSKTKGKAKSKTTRKTSKSAQASKSSTKDTNAKKTSTQKRTTLTKPKKAANSKTKNSIDATIMAINEEQRLKMIAESAYLLAEQRGFKGGDSTKDWLLAEAEVDTLIKKVPSNQKII